MAYCMIFCDSGDLYAFLSRKLVNYTAFPKTITKNDVNCSKII